MPSSGLGCRGKPIMNQLTGATRSVTGKERDDDGIKRLVRRELRGRHTQ